MKVALCISGQPRNALETFPYIYNNIIKPNDADVFFHMNYDSSIDIIEKSHADKGNCKCPPNIDTQLIELYKPKVFLIESPKNFKNIKIKIPPARLERSKKMNKHKNWTDEEHTSYTIRQLYSMYYSIYKSNELKELYALENGINYDYVIRIRFDLLPQQPIICSNYDPAYIYYLEMVQPDNLISDWFNFGSNAIMNVYSSVFLHMEYLNTFTFLNKRDRLQNTYEPSDECGGMSEFFIRDLMFHHKIPKKGIKYNFDLKI